jgi:hypothetical protein
MVPKMILAQITSNVPSRAYFTKCGLLFSENKDDTHGVLKTNKYCLKYTVSNG